MGSQFGALALLFAFLNSVSSDPLVPEHVLDNFKLNRGVKEHYPLSLRSIQGLSIALDHGPSVTLDHLIPISIFSESANCYNNHQQVECPASTVFRKVDQYGRKVLVTENSSGDIETIVVRGGNKPAQTLQAVDPGVFTQIPEEALDEAYDSMFHIRHEELSKRDMRHLRTRLPQDYEQSSPQHRSLAGCSEYRVIELAIAAESSFCASVGLANVNSTINRIVADVALEYEMSGLCFTVEVTHLETQCDPDTDEYKEGVAINLSGCGNYGLLDKFEEFWNANRASVHRDVAQLLSGTGLECDSDGCVIGCAYVGTSCVNPSYSYGVNWVTYTTDTVRQKHLVAHEIGHVLGAGHNSGSTDYIMYPMNGGNERYFDSASISSFLSSQNSCIEASGPTSVPTLSPTSSPTVTRSPTNSPTQSPTSLPTTIPTFTPTSAPVPCTCSAFDGMGGGACNGQCGGTCSWVGKGGTCEGSSGGDGGSDGGGGGSDPVCTESCSTFHSKDLCNGCNTCEWSNKNKVCQLR